MIVTEIEPYTRTKFKVYLDGKFAFVLYKGELSRYGIRKEGEISAGIVEKIETEVVLKRAKLRAMHLLADMDRTEAALREKLKQGCYTQEMIDRAVDYVKSSDTLTMPAMQRISSGAGRAQRAEKRSGQRSCRKACQPSWQSRPLRVVMKTEEKKKLSAVYSGKKGNDPMTAEESEKQRIYGYLQEKVLNMKPSVK